MWRKDGFSGNRVTIRFPAPKVRRHGNDAQHILLRRGRVEVNAARQQCAPDALRQVVRAEGHVWFLATLKRLKYLLRLATLRVDVMRNHVHAGLWRAILQFLQDAVRDLIYAVQQKLSTAESAHRLGVTPYCNSEFAPRNLSFGFAMHPVWKSVTQILFALW